MKGESLKILKIQYANEQNFIENCKGGQNAGVFLDGVDEMLVLSNQKNMYLKARQW